MRNPIETERLDLVVITAAAAEALVAGDAGVLEAAGACRVPAGWPDDHDRRFLQLRLRQMREDPATEGWFASAIVLRDDPARPMIGHAGFHGPPRDDGSLEMGYTIFPEYRGHGYATEAVRGLMSWARAEHGIRKFTLSISPQNAPSLRIAQKLSFVQVGEEMDDEDGLEHVFQLNVP